MTDPVVVGVSVRDRRPSLRSGRTLWVWGAVGSVDRRRWLAHPRHPAKYICKKKARVLDAVVATLLQNVNITMDDDSGEESDDSGYSAWNVNGY